MQEISKKNIRIWSRLGQRGTICGVALPEIAREKKIYVLTADLEQLSGLERFKMNFPEYFLNVGIAEQNMIGVAAGIAFEGNLVFATTYATFLTMRCYEQIRHNLGYQGANVKLIGASSGVAMGMSGNTHYTFEDIAIMRAIPGMMVLSPADSTEAYCMIHELTKYQGPVYLRLSAGQNNPPIYEEDYKYELGKASEIMKGKDVAIIATGSMVYEAVNAAKILQETGISATVINMSVIKPLDCEIIERNLQVKLVVTVEEHSVIGGLGGAVAEFLAKLQEKPRQVMLGIEDKFLHPGEYEYLKEKNGLTAEQIALYIENELK